MDAKARNVSAILHEPGQYLVPLFQRSYSWHKEHWQRLNDDVMALADDPDRQTHFLGPLVCTQGKLTPGSLPEFQLIDGQQRLTTLTIALAAIRDIAQARGLDDLAEEITEDYLIHKRKQGAERFKVLPRLGDRAALQAIINGDSVSNYAHLRLVHAWRFFRRQVVHRARKDPRGELQNLFDTITRRLSLVVITIDGENPYEIFESLNATGLPLAESDLIRNYVFMQVPIAEQEGFDRDHWSPLERNFAHWDDDRATVMTGFYRDYLMREGRYSLERSTFIDFKQQQRERGLTAEQQAAELRHFAPLAVQIRKPETCPDAELARRLSDLVRMDIGTANALVLHLLDRHSRGRLTEEALCTCLDDLISFVLRRTICGETTRPYSRWFVEAIGALKSEPAENLRRYWLQRGWPDDAAFMKALSEFEIYSRESRKARLVLEALEVDSGHKEMVPFAKLEIEHVLPQSVGRDAAGQAWRKALGDKWEEEHARLVHVLGNLTLTGYNPDLGKMAFPDKQKIYRGSHVEMNGYFDGLPVWNADAIDQRGRELARRLCRIWARPAGEPYAGDNDEPVGGAKGSPARRRNLEYWHAFLKHWDKDLGVPPPAPSDGVELEIPFDAERGVVVRLWQFRRSRQIVAYVSLKGKVGRRLYTRLQEKAKELDDMIEGALVWNWPVQHGFSVIEEDVDFSDRNDWELQHAWFHEELADIVTALKPELLQEDFEEEEASPVEIKERHRLRFQFWEGLLRYAETKTSLHANRKAGIYNWIGGSIGRRGFHLNYVIREREAQVELYVDMGKGLEDENRRAFAALWEEKDAVEAGFGEPLEWQDLQDKRACRICKIIQGGWREPPDSWPETQAKMVDAMIRLDRALRTHVQGLHL